MKPFKGPFISPSILSKKKLKEFTAQERRDLTRKGYRWRLYYRYVNPETGELERQSDIYAHLNRDFDNFEERYRAIHIYRKALLKLLRGGYNPYKEPPIELAKQVDGTTVSKAIDDTLVAKRGLMSETSYRSFEGRVLRFKDYLGRNDLLDINIRELQRSHIVKHLDEVVSRTSARNRNNQRTAISSIIGHMVQLDLVEINIVSSIKVLKTKPIIHRSYTREQLAKITETIKESRDPGLQFYLDFFSYSMIREVEALRIKIKDIDPELNYFYLRKSKTVRGRKKSIPGMLKSLMPDVSQYDPDMFLFSVNFKPGHWDTKEHNKSNFYAKRFRAIREKAGLSKEYTMYGYRHTMISRVFKRIHDKTKNLEKALEQTMLITEHQSKSALLKYLRSTNTFEREDYSDLIL